MSSVVDYAPRTQAWSERVASRGVVEQISIAVLKGARLAHPSAVDVGTDGISDDRRFFVIGADGRQYDARHGPLARVRPDWDPLTRHLSLRLPERDVGGVVALGRSVDGLVSWDRNRPVAGREVLGPWSTALSRYLGHPVRLVERLTRPAVDVAPLTMVSIASITRLEGSMQVARLGTDRFRMTLTISGVDAHQEDAWEGMLIEVGQCLLAVGGPVPRCVAVTHDPTTGSRDHPVLKGIVRSRQTANNAQGESIRAPFGVYAFVERPGRIAAGDTVVRQSANHVGGGSERIRG